ncbi:MAG TPA: SLBB domain-containing protein [Planctomycetota bacterium]|nr:SLBB domain-containing protein [Planctomycetota bacterium]
MCSSTRARALLQPRAFRRLGALALCFVPVLSTPLAALDQPGPGPVTPPAITPVTPGQTAPAVPPALTPQAPPPAPGPANVPAGAGGPVNGSVDPTVIDPVTGAYMLQPGDLVKIYVHGMTDLTMDSRVSPNGLLYYPFVKRIKVTGKTIDEVAGLIETGLREHNLKQPEVAVIVEEYAARFAYIYGEVKTPCDLSIPMDRVITLDQAVAKAGGLTKNAAEHRVLVTRRGADGQLATQVVDIDREQPTAESSGFVLRPNDTVFVPSLGGIFILGKVNKPGYAGADVARSAGGELVSASQAVALADGFTPDADPENATVLRINPVTHASENLKINLVEVIEKGRTEADLALKGGDTLVIPAKAGIFVMGEIDKPGKYFTEAGSVLTVTRAIALAGGFKQYAQQSRVKLYRKGKVPLTINVTDILNREELDRDVELQPGDIIFVPESGL